MIFTDFGFRHLFQFIIGGFFCQPLRFCLFRSPQHSWGIKIIIQFGAKGNNVKWLQWHLNQLGEKLTIDGNFGVLVKAAVLRFQKKQKLTQDGIVGAKTRAALKKAVM